MLTAIAGFAEVLTHPAAAGLVVALSLILHRPLHLRLGAAAVGALMALSGHLDGAGLPALAAALLGGVLAALLQAEIMLHLVLPAAHLTWRLAVAAWALTLALIGLVLWPSRRSHPPPVEPEP